MGQNAQQRVHRIAAPRQQRDGQRHGKRHGNRAGKDRHLQRQCQRHAKDRGMGRGITEIGHAPPDDKAAKRGGGQGHTSARERGTGHKIIKHYSTVSACFVVSALSCAWAWPQVSSWVWSWSWR